MILSSLAHLLDGSRNFLSTYRFPEDSFPLFLLLCLTGQNKGLLANEDCVPIDVSGIFNHLCKQHIFLASGSNARLRLMRLSEAAEKLQRQALISVQTGRENDARELLFQKKKVMQALEKTKSRIELLDELSAQLNKVLSLGNH